MRAHGVRWISWMATSWQVVHSFYVWLYVWMFIHNGVSIQKQVSLNTELIWTPSSARPLPNEPAASDSRPTNGLKNLFFTTDYWSSDRQSLGAEDVYHSVCSTHSARVMRTFMPTRACYFSQLFMFFLFFQPCLISVHTALMLFRHYLTKDSCQPY